MKEHRDLWWKSPSVELAKVVQLDLADGFETAYGARLDSIQISYESWGELNQQRDNCVLIIHPLASDCHASGGYLEQPFGWWEALIGPGRPIDTERYFVVCPNLLGGCYGSTGPRFPAPDGEPFLERFPLLTALDLMRVQHLFTKQLGVERIRRVVGPSLGGMIAWEWAIEAGDAVEEVVVVAAPLRTGALQIGLNWLQRSGIDLDLLALEQDQGARQRGMIISRGVGMLSYRSDPGLAEKFGREWFKPPGKLLKDRGTYNIESWLRNHGKKLVRRFDPYSYSLLSRTMDLHDVGENRGGLSPALDKVLCKVQAVGISSDMLYRAQDVQLGIEMLNDLGKTVSYSEIDSLHGHDAFLIETDQLGAILADDPRR
jgi:homoserine O-acetyltransferase